MLLQGPFASRLRFTIIPLAVLIILGASLVRYFVVEAHESEQDVALAAKINAPALVIADSAGKLNSITVDYPEDGSIFPPEITSPTLMWRDPDLHHKTWSIEVRFSDGTPSMRAVSAGEPLQIGEIDPRCISDTNRLPALTQRQAAAHTWKPTEDEWKSMKLHSVAHPATVLIAGLDKDARAAASNPAHFGKVTLSTSKDPVGAPIFYRDVPLMPSEGLKNVVQPLAPASLYLINWRLRDLSKPESRIVIHDLHTCANCHSFSNDGKTMGIDVDGPKNDKGLYAIVPIKQQMTIRNADMVSWNTDMRVGTTRVGFMSQVSPDGQYVVSTFAGQDQNISSSYSITNFKDYRFLQVFFPTRGILAVYSRATGRREPLPGADDPRYVQTDGVWSPDGKYIVFARAEAQDPTPPGMKPALFANDPHEIQIRYSLYRIPFNNGRGGVAEPVTGASLNGMSNNFPKVSPDGRWIIFVRCRNGQLMRPDSQLYIVPFKGGVARRMRCNTSLMNSWHSFSPNGRWLVFSSKSRSPYTGMFLTHIDEDGNDSPPIFIDNSTASNRAVNLPEFVNTSADNMQKIDVPASDFYKVVDNALDLQKQGDSTAATSEWQKALEMDPNDARSNNGMAVALSVAGKSQESIEYFRKAVVLNGDFFEAYYNLGLELIKENQIDEAISAWLNAVRVRPQFAAGHENLGYAYYLQGKPAESLMHLRLALETEPDRVSVLNLAASIMATSPDPTTRNGRLAVSFATHAKDLTQGADAAILDTLSAAYAERGLFAQAVSTEELALGLASANPQLTTTLRAHLANLRSNRPLREPPDPVSF